MARDARQHGTTAELSGFAWIPDRFNPRVRAGSEPAVATSILFRGCSARKGQRHARGGAWPLPGLGDRAR